MVSIISSHTVQHTLSKVASFPVLRSARSLREFQANQAVLRTEEPQRSLSIATCIASTSALRGPSKPVQVTRSRAWCTRNTSPHVLSSRDAYFHSFTGPRRAGNMPTSTPVLGRVSAGQTESETQSMGGIEALVADGYSTWLLDQFGVLHDGQQAYPGAVEAIAKLHAAGARLYILSNSSRRAGRTLDFIASKGFEPGHFAGVVTSGEVTHTMLSERPEGTVFERLGRRCVHFTWGARGAVSLDGLGLTLVTAAEEADFLLAHGTEAINGVDASLDEMKQVLQQAAPRSLPLIVANPDIVTVDGTREMKAMPGQLAQWYSEMGGEVHLMGKPAAVIYKTAMALAGAAEDPTKVIAVGDSLEHDIRGAQNAQIASVFVAGGIHADHLGMQITPTEPKPRTSEKNYVEHPEGDRLRQLLSDYQVAPPYCIPGFRW